MVAINKILLPECAAEGCGGGTRNRPREARLHVCSPFHLLLSPFCRRSRPARDPIGYQGGINLYGYVNSSPVGMNDPSGRFIVGAILGGISGAIGGAIGAASQGGNVWQDLEGAAIGGAFGAAAGGFAPPGTGWAVAASGATGALGDYFGQLAGNGWNFGNVNYGQVATNGVLNALGEDILSPAAGALNKLGDAVESAADKAIVNAARAGMALLRGLMKGADTDLSKAIFPNHQAPPCKGANRTPEPSWKPSNWTEIIGGPTGAMLLNNEGQAIPVSPSPTPYPLNQIDAHFNPDGTVSGWQLYSNGQWQPITPGG
jgi:hypothetical protein